MTPLFWPAVGVLTMIGGGMMFLAGAPNAYSIVALVTGGGLALGSLIALFVPKRK